MIQVPFVKRKLILNYEDPSEAIGIILGEVQEVETTLRQCVEIGGFVLERNKELIAENRRMQICVENMQREHSKAIAEQQNALDQLKLQS